MVPDLRKPVNYPAPLPKPILGLYVIVLMGMIAASIQLATTCRDGSRIAADVKRKQADIATAREQAQAFDRQVEGLESSKAIRSSLERWTSSNVPVSELEASALIAVTESSDALEQQRKKAEASQAKVTHGRTASRSPGKAIVLRSLAIEVHPDEPGRVDGGTAELKLEMTRNPEVDARKIITELSTRLGRFSLEGLAMSNFKPEDRGSSLVVTATWKKASGPNQ